SCPPPTAPCANASASPTARDDTPAAVRVGDGPMSEVDLRVDCGIATITMNRPERLNAMNPAMREQLVGVFDETDADDRVRVVVVTGAGRGFCAGADVSAGETAFVYDEGDVRLRDGGGRIVLRAFDSLKP